MHLKDVRRRKDAVDLWNVLRRRHFDDLELFLFLGVIDEYVEHEAILLSFRQWIGAFLLKRVLGCKHVERMGQVVAHAGDRHVMLLHRLKERGLRARARAVDFVGHQELREHGALDEAE